jgi:hypothetical protein
MLRGGRIERRLEICDEILDRLAIGPRSARRRHELAAELADGLLPNLGVRAQVEQITVLEHEIGLAVDLVVAIEAEAADGFGMPSRELFG